MNERMTRAAEIGCVLIVAAGFGLAWLPLGLIVGGALLLLGMQGVSARRDGP